MKKPPSTGRSEISDKTDGTLWKSFEKSITHVHHSHNFWKPDAIILSIKKNSQNISAYKINYAISEKRESMHILLSQTAHSLQSRLEVPVNCRRLFEQ